jgi:glycosyltransferase involved in cell wall biosynthesis
VTGWKCKESAIKYLHDADIYLSTSLWEGLPISVLQAMCYSKPLVLSDCTGNKDLIVDNGYLCQSKEEIIVAINCLRSDAQKRIDLAHI